MHIRLWQRPLHYNVQHSNNNKIHCVCVHWAHHSLWFQPLSVVCHWQDRDLNYFNLPLYRKDRILSPELYIAKGLPMHYHKLAAGLSESKSQWKQMLHDNDNCICTSSVLKTGLGLLTVNEVNIQSNPKPVQTMIGNTARVPCTLMQRRM